jgi:hypothetical protein
MRNLQREIVEERETKRKNRATNFQEEVWQVRIIEVRNDLIVEIKSHLGDERVEEALGNEIIINRHKWYFY